MDNQVLEVNVLSDRPDESPSTELKELSDLQLAVAGGGCAEVCPY